MAKHYIQSVEEFYQYIDLDVPVMDVDLAGAWTKGNLGSIAGLGYSGQAALNAWIARKDLYIETE